MDHFSDEIVAATANCESLVFAYDVLNSRDGFKMSFGGRVIGDEDDSSLGAVASDESLGSVHVDDSAALDDGHAIAEALSLLHEMSG